MNYQGLKEEYTNVMELVSTLNHELNHKVMVQIGPLAFMPGKLTHTNELTVLLGENWFVERTTHQTMQILDRRLEEIDIKLSELNGTKVVSKETETNKSKDSNNKLVQILKNEKSLFGKHELEIDGKDDKMIEIKEEYHSDEEKKLKSIIKKENKPISKKQVKPKAGPRQKTPKEIEEDRKLMEFIRQMEEEEIANGEVDKKDEEPYKPYPIRLDDDAEEEDEDEEYREGLEYTGQPEICELEDQVEPESESEEEADNKDKEEEQLMEAIRAHQEIRAQNTKTIKEAKEKGIEKGIEKADQLKKQVRFSQEVEESSHRKPHEFATSPFWDMLTNATLDDSTSDIPTPSSSKPGSKNTSVMSMKVAEKPISDDIDAEDLEGAIEYQMLAEEYHRRRSAFIATEGGYSTSLEESEEREYNRYTFDDTPSTLPSSSIQELNETQAQDQEPVQHTQTRPKKVSKFKAARLAGAI